MPKKCESCERVAEETGGVTTRCIIHDDLGSIGGQCSFGTMDWYCVLPANHDGPHKSGSFA